MRHDVGVEWPNRKQETVHVNFVIYGNPTGYSAMAATVGYPTAIAAKMVLEGRYLDLLAGFKQGSRNFTGLSGIVSPTNAPEMTSLAASGRLQKGELDENAHQLWDEAKRATVSSL